MEYQELKIGTRVCINGSYGTITAMIDSHVAIKFDSGSQYVFSRNSIRQNEIIAETNGLTYGTQLTFL